MYHKTYSLGDFRLVIEHARPEHAARGGTLWESLFAVGNSPATAAGPATRFQFLSSADAASDVQQIRPVSSLGGVQVGRTPRGFRLATGSSVLDVDLTRGVARGVLRESFWQLRSDEQRRFLLLALVMLAHAHGRYALHANGVALGDRGCLMIGPSGSGKTTLGLSLARHGWNYLSDDVVLLRHRTADVTAFGVTRGFSCTAPTATCLAALPRHVTGTGDKTLWSARDMEPLKQVSECRPAWLLFPQIVSRPTSQLAPMGPAEAMGCLIQYSAGILVDRTKSIKQLAMLKHLVGQARCYRLLAGSDVLHEPERVARWLAEVPG